MYMGVVKNLTKSVFYWKNFPPPDFFLLKNILDYINVYGVVKNLTKSVLLTENEKDWLITFDWLTDKVWQTN